jgi:hypothetical protein
MRRTRFAALAAAVAASLLLAACGGDDSGSDEDADITEAITQAATEDTVESCTEVQTQAFTEQTEFATGDDAIASCEDGAGDGDTAGEEVEVENIEVDGDAATADVTFSGGGLDGQQLAVSLVKEEDQWKLDSLDEFIAFDKAAFTESLVTSASADGDTPPEVVDCVETQLNETPDDQLQTAYLSGDEEELVTLFGTCFGDA